MPTDLVQLVRRFACCLILIAAATATRAGGSKSPRRAHPLLNTGALILCADLAAGGLSSKAHGAPNLVTNPGFESGTTGWTFSDCAGAFLAGSFPHTGIGAAYLNFCGVFTGGSISQSIATTNGDQYEVSFWIDSLQGGGGIDNLTASFGPTVGYSPPNLLGTPYTDVIFDAVATNSTSLLQFADTGASGTYWFDDVSVTDLGPVTPPVPEPGSLLLLSGGLLGLFVIRSRKRN